MLRLIILGRDGVINEHADAGILSAEDWRPLPGSLEAIARLTQAHYHVVIITNQPGISQGRLDIDTLHQIHSRLKQELARRGGRIDAIYYCPHGPDDGCQCRKPNAGMFRDLAKRLQLDLTEAVAIGDSWQDLQVARAVKARPMLVRTGLGRATEQKMQQQGEGLEGLAVFDDLAAAVDQLLSAMS